MDVDAEDYLKMAEQKTAQLFECSVHLGAFLGTDNQAGIAHLCSFGRKVGLAFQIRNDMLDIWGEKEYVGSIPFSDIEQKKKTLPLIYALERVENKGRGRLLEICRKKKYSAKDAATVLRILDSTGVRVYAEQVIERYHREALQELESASLLPSAKQELKEMADFLLWDDV